MSAQTLELGELGETASRSPRTHFYTSKTEDDRTLRMEMGGICQLCARPARQRVELHSPLWHAGPILYGECCLPQAEEALYVAKFGPRPAAPAPKIKPSGHFWKAWQVAALALTALSAAAGWKWLF